MPSRGLCRVGITRLIEGRSAAPLMAQAPGSSRRFSGSPHLSCGMLPFVIGSAMPEWVNVEDDAGGNSPAEQRLVDAMAAEVICDFGGGAAITADEMASWGPERTIRATVLRQLLTAEKAHNAPNGVLLRGAAIEGILDIKDISAVKFDLQHCRIATIDASGAIFTGDASFDGATFTGDALFDGVTFISKARFRRAIFANHAWFGRAIADTYDFSWAQFYKTDPGPWVAQYVTLAGAAFHVRARVEIASLWNDCQRLQAREGVDLVCRGGRAVDLEDAEFLQRSILAHSASDPSIPVRDEPRKRPEGFDELTSAEQAPWTARAKASWLAQSLANLLAPQSLEAWLDPQPNQFGPQPAERTWVVSLRRARAGDLVLSDIGLEECAFAGAQGLDKLRIDVTCSFQRPPAWRRDTWWPFADRRVIFEEVQWRAAHTRGWGARDGLGSAGDSWTVGFSRAIAERDRVLPTALEIAGIYRDLRKGLEDAKDEAGAADFYYGEMEMRRLAARKTRPPNTDSGEPKGRRPPWTERTLLNAYWAVSGYGLRAWRAMAALAVLLVGCAVLFTIPALAQLPAVPQHVSSVDLRTGVLQYTPGAQPCVKTNSSTAATFARSMEFTARESLTLTRAAGDPLLTTCGPGTALDIALRLLAPLLLGLAVLAVRGRTKR